MISYLQQQGVALEDPDWGMQDETIPYSHEQVTWPNPGPNPGPSPNPNPRPHFNLALTPTSV
jgi:hypothetical protein